MAKLLKCLFLLLGSLVLVNSCKSRTIADVEVSKKKIKQRNDKYVYKSSNYTSKIYCL